MAHDYDLEGFMYNNEVPEDGDELDPITDKEVVLELMDDYDVSPTDTLQTLLDAIEKGE